MAPKKPATALNSDILSIPTRLVRYVLGLWQSISEGGVGSTRERGRQGERIAERYLVRRGYRIITRNFRGAGAEIDLVAMDGTTLVFVEVKTRRSSAAGSAAEALDSRKQARIRRAAQAFSLRYGADGRAMRFDVVAIDGVGRDLRFELLKDAF